MPRLHGDVQFLAGSGFVIPAVLATPLRAGVRMYDCRACCQFVGNEGIVSFAFAGAPRGSVTCLDVFGVGAMRSQYGHEQGRGAVAEAASAAAAKRRSRVTWERHVV